MSRPVPADSEALHVPRWFSTHRHATVFSAVQAQAARQSEKTAVRFLSDGGSDETCLSFAELDRAARTLAARLQAEQARGERVLILLVPGIDYVVSVLACLYAGAIAVPAYPPRRRTLDRLNAIAQDCAAAFALASADDIARLSDRLHATIATPRMRWIAVDITEAGPSAEDWRAPDLAPNEVALLQYTSGSTGSPKGVCLSQANFLANIAALCEGIGISPEDRSVSWLPPFHDMGLLSGILLPACTGMETTLMSPGAFLQRPFRWLEAVSRFGANYSGGPSFAYELCVRRITEPEQIASLDLTQWRGAFCGAERVHHETVDRFFRAFAPAGFAPRAMIGCYGLAESTLAVSFGHPSRLPKIIDLDERALRSGRVEPAGPSGAAVRLVDCGTALPGCDLLIVDPETRAVLPEGRVGEIWTRSASVGQGYWNQPSLSAATFQATLAHSDRERFLRTGDLGFLQNQNLFVTGRIKDLIILRGVNHYPDDFEVSMRAAHSCLATGGSAAFGVEVEGEERLIVVQEIPRQRDLALQELEALIRDAIAQEHEIAVHEVVLVAPGGLPRTSSGKVQRRAARQDYLDGRLASLAVAERSAAAAVEVDTQRVAAVADLMAQLLGLPKVLPSDDFFWLGGHSLLATQLVSRIRARFAVDLPLPMIFEASTPLRLAAAIAAAPANYVMPRILRGAPDSPARLSFSQERMWMLHQLDPQGAAYNVAGAVYLDGPLDPAAFQHALDDLIRRHEVLRTTYPAVDGAPSVVVADTLQVPIAVKDVSDCSDPAAQALTEASALAHRPFAIASEPLLRIAIWRLGPERHLVAATLHHMITDGWSMGVLVGELLQGHDEHVAGRASSCPAPEVSYLDYARWQREFLTDERLADDLAYWKERLAGSSPIELPSDRPRSALSSSRGDFVPLTLPDELLQRLTAFGAARGTTLFMVLLAAFEVLLHRHTGSTDLVVGIPCANRNHLASEQLLGSLVNTLALRLRFDPDRPFVDLLHEVRDVALDAYAHQDLPFERLVSALPVERRAGQSPVVSVLFDYQNAPIYALREGRLSARPAVVSRQSAQFDLSLLIFDTDIGRSAGFEYRSELFDRASIERLLAHYLLILEQIILDPAQSPAAMPILTPAERRAVLALAGPDRPVDGPALAVPQAIHQQALRTPDRIALQDDLGVLSYQALDAESERLALHLQSLGAGPGERVAVALGRDRDLAIALLAVLKSGAAYVPLDPGYPADRIAYVLEDCQPSVVLTTRVLQASLPTTPFAVCCLDALPLPAPVSGAAAHGPGPVAYVLYTSGSTGRPKGVEVGAPALANFLRSMAHTPGITADDRLLAITTISFDIAGLEIWLPLTQGASVRLASAATAADPQALMRLIGEYQPTLMQATPATWRMLIAAEWAGQPGLKMLCGGEALPADLVPQLLSRGASLWNMYGPTETTIWSAVHQVSPADGVRIPIGRPIDATRLYVLDRLGQLQPLGVTGELHIGGSGVANGYFERPELTAERFLPDPFAAEPGARMYRTGDGGRLRADGTFECMPRLDDQIKLRGFRIEPGEIEAVLKDHPEVSDAVVVAPEIAPGDRRLVAYFVLRASGGADPSLLESLQTHVQRKLPGYMVPQLLVHLQALPKTPNGKIDRKALPAPRFSDLQSGEPFVAPCDALETDLVALWQELLGVERIGVRDSFFRLGGHSLLAMRMFAQVQKRHGVALAPALMFEHPTIEHLAEQIRGQLPTAAAAAASSPQQHPETGGAAARLAARFDHLVRIRAEGSRPSLYCIHGAGGNVFNFAELANELPPVHPVYAFQARGVDGITVPHTDISAMADAYLAELQVLQPAGPYHLAGYCGGGIIAFEMACRLRAQGEEVAALVLIDCYFPGVAQGQNLAAAGRPTRTFGQRAISWIQRHATELSSKAVIAWHRWLGSPVPFELRDFWLTHAYLQAVQRYVPSVYPGDLTLLRAIDATPELRAVGNDLGWSGHVRGRIETILVPGDHHTLLTQPNLHDVARALAKRLDAGVPPAAV